jgi:hypothetical protein
MEANTLAFPQPRINREELYEYVSSEIQKERGLEEVCREYAQLANSTTASIQSLWYAINKKRRAEGLPVSTGRRASTRIRYDLDGDDLIATINQTMLEDKALSLREACTRYAILKGATVDAVMRTYKKTRKENREERRKLNPKKAAAQAAAQEVDFLQVFARIGELSKSTGVQLEPIFSALLPLFEVAGKSLLAERQVIENSVSREDFDAAVQLGRKAQKELEEIEGDYKILNNKLTAIEEVLAPFEKLGAMEKLSSLGKFLEELRLIMPSQSTAPLIVGPGGLVLTRAELQHQ